MVYSKKVKRRPSYEPVKKIQKVQKGNPRGKKSLSPTIRQEKSGPPSLVDVATKAVNVLNSVQRDGHVSESKELGSDTKYWQRLPSQSVSFESGEILTVQECISNAEIYRNKTIRTTGLLVRRDLENVEGRALLKLLIRHPIQAKAQKLIEKNSAGLWPQVTTPRSNFSPKPCLVDNTRKRPLVRRKLSSRTSQVPQLKNRHPQDKYNEPLLAVEVDSALAGLSSLVAGSTVVMVIGILREDGTVLSRIVKRLEHFDASRHIQFLNARRQMIYNKHLQRSGQTKSSALGDNGASLIHGCGPPPYGSSA